jgi:hypothetical protein
MRYFFLVSVLLFSSFGVSAHGNHDLSQDADQTLSAFEQMLPVVSSVSIPTVVAVPVSDLAFRVHDAVVYEETTRRFQPYLFVEKQNFFRASVQINTQAVSNTGTADALTDGNGDTMTEFPLETDKASDAELLVTFSRPIGVSGFSLSLDRYVALPQSVSVLVPSVDGEVAPRIVLAQSSLSGTAVRFPKVTTNVLIIKLKYGQPLRIREINFLEESISLADEKSIRFLARPGEKYTLYAYSDRGYIASVGESGNLKDDVGVKNLLGGQMRMNPLYQPADSDGDGVIDRKDNCVRLANIDQRDENKNGQGDECDDYDRDSVMNSQDNCPAHPNRIQTDTDRDGKGDVCDDEESRMTEKYAWMPWVSIGLGIVVVGGLFVSVFKRTRSAQ